MNEFEIIGAASDTVVYAHMEAEEARAVWLLLPEPRPMIVALRADWNKDLSPWPARRAFRGGEDFAGGGKAHLEALISEIIPAAEAAMPEPKRRIIAGYSLGGLFAVYAACASDAFDALASMSGSLWYDGLIDWLRAANPSPRLRRAYFSLGDMEPRTRNARLAAVGECTQTVCGILAEKGVETSFEWNSGGHFDDVTERIARGIGNLQTSFQPREAMKGV